MVIQKSIRIKTNREVLWTWLTELEKMKKWNPGIIREEAISNGESGAGFRSKVLIREGRKDIWYNNEILAYDPGTLLRIVLSGGHLGKHPMELDYKITEEGHQVLLHLESRWKPSGLLLHLLYPLIKLKATKSTNEMLRSLKQHIEN